MKVISQYRSRIIAEDDHNYLMSHGIAAVIYGDDAPQCLIEYFGTDPILLAVLDEFNEQAKKLLIDKKEKDLIIEIPKWIAKQAKAQSGK